VAPIIGKQKGTSFCFEFEWFPHLIIR